MRFKKSMIASIAAMAMLCSGAAGICYAENSSEQNTGTAVSSEAAKETEKISVITEVKAGFDSVRVLLIADDGQIYCEGTAANAGKYIFTMNGSGKIGKKVKLSDNTDDFIAGVKQLGDNICILYNEYDYTGIQFGEDTSGTGWTEFYLPPGGGMQDLYMVILDKNLEQTAKYDVTSYTSMKKDQFVGVNSTKICYARGFKKLYTVNHDGSDKKLVLDISKTDYSGCYIDCIAVTEDHAALYLNDRYSGNRYCAAVDLETGELTAEKRDHLSYPEAFGNTVIWRSAIPSDEDEADLRGEELVNRVLENTKKANQEGYFPGVEFVMFKDGEFSTARTVKPIEAVTEAFVDNDGRIITSSTIKNDYPDELYGYDLVVRVYENSKCIQEFELDARDYCPDSKAIPGGISLMTANNGIISVGYAYKLNGESSYSHGILLVPYDTKQ